MTFRSWFRSYVIFGFATFGVGQLLVARTSDSKLSTLPSLLGLEAPTPFCACHLSIEKTVVYSTTVSVFRTTFETVPRSTLIETATISGVGTITVTTNTAAIITSTIATVSIKITTTVVWTTVGLQKRDVANAVVPLALAIPDTVFIVEPSGVSPACTCLSILTPTILDLITTQISILTSHVTPLTTLTITSNDFTTVKTIFTASTTTTSIQPITATSTATLTTSTVVYDPQFAASVECSPEELSTSLYVLGGGTLISPTRSMTRASQTLGVDMGGCCHDCVVALNCVAYQYFLANGSCEIFVAADQQPVDVPLELVCPLGVNGLSVATGDYASGVGGFFSGPCDLGGDIQSFTMSM